MLRRYTWEKAKEKLQHYRRRTPEASVLYQIVYHSSGDLSVQWESRFQHQYGCLRDEVITERERERSSRFPSRNSEIQDYEPPHHLSML